MGHLNFGSAFTAIQVCLHLEDNLLRKMPHKPTFFYISTGKRRCCLLNVMVQFVSFSPDKIWQAGDLT